MEKVEERISSFFCDLQRLGPERARLDFDEFSAGETGRLFIDLLFLSSVIDQILERRSTSRRESRDDAGTDVLRDLNAALENESSLLAFLSSLSSMPLPTDFKVLSRVVKRVLKDLSSKQALEGNRASFCSFVRVAVERMAELMFFNSTKKAGATVVPEVFYRAFDSLDEVFGLHFSRESVMKSFAGTRERLFEGAGSGVQTSYSVIMTALRYLRLPLGAHLMDLGSGYGRVGLIAGLWRPDLSFTGYEYVAHRVEVANAAAERADLGGRVRFLAQDLGDPAFEVPEADAYYLYDPFCAETYAKILRRIHEIGETRPVAVVTKGSAGPWFERSITTGCWLQPERYDHDTLFIFRSSNQAKIL